MIVVQKYGGSSVAGLDKMRSVALRIIKAKEAGFRVVVVLSAQGKYTDTMLAQANAANPAGSKREKDLILATGEQISVSLMALILQGMGHSAKSLNARQAGIISSSDFGSARIRSINKQKISNELDKGNIVIITGFQGETMEGDVTTLGRGGSDTTAVALAAALNAHACEIYTDVDGVYSADPRIVSDAKKLSEISYDEMFELAAMGSQVLAKRAVGMAKMYNVRLLVLSSTEEVEGTVVKEECSVEGIFIGGITPHKNIVRMTITGIADAPGVWYKVFDTMSEGDISIDFVEQKKLDDGTKDISFVLDAQRLEDVKSILAANTHRLGFSELLSDESLAMLSVVSAGMASNPSVPSIMFEALFNAGINIDSISTSETRVSVLIDKAQADFATQVVHTKFKEQNYIREM